jgi:hypothetical protein
MCLMNDVLCPFIDSFVIVYLDEILIFSTMWKESVFFFSFEVGTRGTK